VKVCYLTDRGPQKDVNEDCLLVDKSLGLYILADGMGGHNAGEVASRLAVDVIAWEVWKGLQTDTKEERLLREAIEVANRTVLEKSLINPAWEEMGTTVVAALISGEDLFISHVGNSRAYLIGDGEIEQIAQDHTFVAEWLKEGRITSHQARTHPQRHGLTEVVGVTDDVESDVAVLPWDGEKCLLLCSDGLTDMLEDQEILEIVESQDDPALACQKLVDAANKRGGKDNVSVILVCGE